MGHSRKKARKNQCRRTGQQQTAAELQHVWPFRNAKSRRQLKNGGGTGVGGATDENDGPAGSVSLLLLLKREEAEEEEETEPSN